MLKSTGVKKINIAVFISGTGTNFKNLIQYSLKKQSKFKIKLVVSNNLNAKGLEYAKKFKIKKKIINYKNLINSEIRILNDLYKENINIICLAGFMRILTTNFIKKFRGKIINIHPSLLPKYKGLMTHKRMLINKEAKYGYSIHKVTKYLDDGEILNKNQRNIFTYNEDELSLNQKRLEHQSVFKDLVSFLN